MLLNAERKQEYLNILNTKITVFSILQNIQCKKLQKNPRGCTPTGIKDERDVQLSLNAITQLLIFRPVTLL